MTARDPERLLARVRQLRRRQAGTPAQASEAPATPDVPALEARMTHLEQLLQGLQDSVHREVSRQGRRIAELEARVEPAAMGRALDQDARERGL